VERAVEIGAATASLDLPLTNGAKPAAVPAAPSP
jgi:hypothetical protein